MYAGWTDPLVQAADIVVWLDLPGRLAGWGVLARQARCIRRGDPDRADLRGVLRLGWRASWGYRHGPVATVAQLRERDGANSTATIGAALADRSGPVVRCRSRRDVARLRADIANR